MVTGNVDDAVVTYHMGAQSSWQLCSFKVTFFFHFLDLVFVNRILL